MQRKLGDLDIFRETAPETVGDLERRCRWLEFEKGDAVIEAGGRPEKVFFLLSGELRFSVITRTGKVLTLPAIGPGSFLGFTALTSIEVFPYTVEATRLSTVASLGVRTFQEVLQRDTRLQQALFESLVRYQQILIDHIEELATLSVRERVHNELLRLCRSNTYSDGSAVIYPIPTHEDLAHRVGTHREAVSREMSHLHQLGVILRHDSAFIVPDVARLVNEPSGARD